MSETIGHGTITTPSFRLTAGVGACGFGLLRAPACPAHGVTGLVSVVIRAIDPAITRPADMARVARSMGWRRRTGHRATPFRRADPAVGPGVRP